MRLQTDMVCISKSVYLSIHLSYLSIIPVETKCWVITGFAFPTELQSLALDGHDPSRLKSAKCGLSNP